jgi:hypothetical protein
VGGLFGWARRLFLVILEDIKMSLLFGVEIEVTRGKCTYENLKEVCIPRWRNIPDYSIKPRGREFVSPIFDWDNRGQVFDSVTILQRFGARCNQSCGFHVHMSGNFPEWSSSLVEYLEEWYTHLQGGFKSAKRRERLHCTRDLSFSNGRYRFIRPVNKDGDRLHIEIRLFNIHLCKRWIARCLWEAKKLGESLEQMAVDAVQVETMEWIPSAVSSV